MGVHVYSILIVHSGSNGHNNINRIAWVQGSGILMFIFPNRIHLGCCKFSVGGGTSK